MHPTHSTSDDWKHLPREDADTFPSAEEWKLLNPDDADSVPDPDEWFSDLPTTIRIDLTINVLNNHGLKEVPVSTIAALAECTEAAIYDRLSRAVAAARPQAQLLHLSSLSTY